MTRFIQKVPLDKIKALYLIAFNPKTMTLKYRPSWKPKSLITEQITITGEKVELTDHWFHISFLNKLIKP